MDSKHSSILIIWILILIFELFWFNGLLNRVHEQNDVLFVMTVILVTLIVGAMLLLLSVLSTKKK
jgi:hypothetical protein